MKGCGFSHPVELDEEGWDSLLGSPLTAAFDETFGEDKIFSMEKIYYRVNLTLKSWMMVFF